jgi:hypothetical protein
MDLFSPSANAFRFYDDDAGEATSTPLANQDTNVTVNVSAGDVALQLRYRVQNTTAVAGAATDDFAIQASVNAGAYATVTTSTADVIASASGLTNDGATTNRATNGITDGTGGFLAGEQCADGTLDNFTHTASTFTEHVWGLTVVSADVANGDTIDFRVSLNGGTPGMTNAVTPRITVQKSITGTGALSAQAGDVAGSGTSSSTGTGALSAQAAAVDGAGESAWVGTGALSAQAASADGAGTSSSTGTGALAAQAAAVDGAGVSSSTGAGALSSQAAAVAGVGVSSSTGTGALNAQSATVAGEGTAASGDITGTGALASQAGAVAGVGVSSSTGTGALSAQTAAVDGSGTSASTGAGALAAPSAATAGAGTSRSTGTGALSAQAATVAGTGSSSSLGGGILEAGNAIIVGVGAATIALIPRNPVEPGAGRSLRPQRAAATEPSSSAASPVGNAAYAVPANRTVKPS